MQPATILISICLCAGPALADDPFFFAIGFLPGGDHTQDHAISPDGSTVVGLGDSTIADLEAFRWTNPDDGGEGIVGLGVPDPFLLSGAFAAAADGHTLACAVADPFLAAYIWTDPDAGGVGWWVPLELIDGYADPNPTDISADATVIVGWLTQPDGQLPTSFRWVLTDPDTGDGVMTDLGHLPGHVYSRAQAVSADGAVVVGESGGELNQQREPFRWEDGEMIGLGTFGGSSGTAYDVSADGSVVVGRAYPPPDDDGSKSLPFRWTEADGLVELPLPPGPYAGGLALGVSADAATIVGYVTEPLQQNPRAAIWTEPGGVELLEDVLMDLGLDTTGWTLLTAEGVSADGRTIVGSGTDPDGFAHAGWVAHLGAVCPADVNGDGTLNVLDFVAFQLLWVDQDPGADCDANAEFNVLDFVCFQQLFVDGCP